MARTNKRKIAIKDEGVTVTVDANSLNFTGSGVLVTSDASGNVTVAISGGGGGGDWLADGSYGAATGDWDLGSFSLFNIDDVSSTSVTTGTAYVSGTIHNANGTAAFPSYTFGAATTAGLNLLPDNISLGLSVMGVNRVTIGNVSVSSTLLFNAPSINVSGLTASRAMVTDGSKNLASSATTSTELGFVSGVTSSIQTQINSKISSQWTTSGSDIYYNTGKVGIGTGATISAALHSISTTEQLRSGYDTSNYWNAVTGSTGATTIDGVGTSASFSFGKPLRINNGSGTTNPFGTSALDVTAHTNSTDLSNNAARFYALNRSQYTALSWNGLFATTRIDIVPASGNDVNLWPSVSSQGTVGISNPSLGAPNNARLFVTGNPANSSLPAGTVSATAGGTVITGSGTNFNVAIGQGYIVTVGSNMYHVREVTSATSIKIFGTIVSTFSASSWTFTKPTAYFQNNAQSAGGGVDALGNFVISNLVSPSLMLHLGNTGASTQAWINRVTASNNNRYEVRNDTANATPFYIDGLAPDLSQFVDSTGKTNLIASSTSGASLRIPAGIPPSSPVHGDAWTDTSHLYMRLNGVTYQLDQQAGTGVTSVSGTVNRITSTGGTTPAIDISSTFEALLGKVANRIDQNNAATTSAQLASVISDETGTGKLVFATAPTFNGIVDITNTSNVTGLRVTGFSTQTANLQEWRNNTPTVVASIDNSGNITGNAINAISQIQFTSPVFTQFQATSAGVNMEFQTASNGGAGGAIIFKPGTVESLRATETTVEVTGNLKLKVAGNGIYIKEGTNACMGIATLVGGTVVVSTTKTTASSRIFLTGQGGNILNLGSYSVTARTAGTSFTISSSNVLDTNTVAWEIKEPA